MQNIEALAILTLMKEELLHNLEHDFPVAKARLKDRFGLTLPKTLQINLGETLSPNASVEDRIVAIREFGDNQSWFDIFSFFTCKSGMTQTGLTRANIYCQWKYRKKTYGMNEEILYEGVVFNPEFVNRIFGNVLENERLRPRSKSREKKAIQIVKNLMTNSK